MKVSFSELSDFLLDPEEWAGTKLAASSSPRMSYAHVTRMAVYRFHQKKSKTTALTALNRYLDSYHLVNDEKRALAEAQLSRYIEWTEKNGPVVIGVAARIRVELGSGLYSSGQVHRVDLDLASGGYQAILLGSPLTSSKDPRATVIKLGYADLAKRDPKLIVPSSQNLDGSGFVIQSPNHKRALTILDELKDAARIAAAKLAKGK